MTESTANWDLALPFLEIAWNNSAVQDTLNMGFHPSFWDDHFEHHANLPHDVNAQDYVQQMQHAYQDFSAILRKKQQQVETRVNKHRRITSFRRGQLHGQETCQEFQDF